MASLNTDTAYKALTSGATQATDLSKVFGSQGLDLFGPASQYLKALLSGDQQALMQATMPERRRVIDQYSAAKKSIAEFSPRSGGQAASINKLQSQEAGDLAQLGGGARTNALGQALSTGTQLEGLGLTANSAASQNWAAILQGLTQEQANKDSLWGNLAQGAGTLLGLAFL